MNSCFHYRHSVKVCYLVGLLVLVLLCACSKPTTGSKYNVVLISIETFRADHLSCYGYFRETSPAIDEFAKNSILFRNAFSQSALTLSSHMSMLTSTYPTVHGLMNSKEFIPLSQKIAILPEILKDHGYRTVGFYDGHHLDPRYGFGRGFDVYEWKDNEEVLKNIDKGKHNSFFLFVHFFDVHSSDFDASDYLYDGPPEFRDKYIKAPPVHAPRDIYQGGARISAEELEQIIAQYDGGILYVDSQLSELFDKLKEEGLYDNSMIIVTADHGESLGFRGIMSSHGWLFDVGAHIPLIIKLPKQYAPPVHLPHEVNSLARSVDIMPTILDVLSIEPPPYINGESLLETGGERINYARQGNGFAVRTKDSKILVFTEDGQHSFMRKGNIELYDLNDDPQESNNLYGRDEVRS